MNNRIASLLVAGLITASWALTQPLDDPPLPPGAIQTPPGGIRWGDGPSSLPPGTKIAVLEGDPRKEGIFTMRLKVPAGAKLPPHFHPRDERVTVLSGEVRVGFGDVFDESHMKSFETESFYVNPAGSHHFVSFPKETVIQITGAGPWELRKIEQKD